MLPDSIAESNPTLAAQLRRHLDDYGPTLDCRVQAFLVLLVHHIRSENTAHAMLSAGPSVLTGIGYIAERGLTESATGNYKARNTMENANFSISRTMEEFNLLLGSPSGSLAYPMLPTTDGSRQVAFAENTRRRERDTCAMTGEPSADLQGAHLIPLTVIGKDSDKSYYWQLLKILFGEAVMRTIYCDTLTPDGDESPKNGIFLRSDVHTGFDAGNWRIHAATPPSPPGNSTVLDILLIHVCGPAPLTSLPAHPGAATIPGRRVTNKDIIRMTTPCAETLPLPSTLLLETRAAIQRLSHSCGFHTDINKPPAKRLREVGVKTRRSTKAKKNNERAGKGQGTGSTADTTTTSATQASAATSGNDDLGQGWVTIAEMLGYERALESEDGEEEQSEVSEDRWRVLDSPEEEENLKAEETDTEAERQQAGESAVRNCGSNTQSSGD